MEQTILDNVVRGGHLVFSEGYLCQIIFTLMRVVRGAVGLGGLLSANAVCYGGSFQVCQTVRTFRRFLIVHGQVHHRPVDAAPVVGVLAFAPLLLEVLLTLIYGHGIVEVPLAVALCGSSWCGAVGCVGTVALGTALCQLLFHLSLLCLLPLFLLFLFQGFNHAVDSLQTLFFRHLGQFLQRVLQMDGLRERHQLVKHFRAVREFFVVGTLLVQHTDG